MIAVDDNSSAIPNKCDVISKGGESKEIRCGCDRTTTNPLTAEEALKEFLPFFVVVSWCGPGLDFTPLLAATPSVLSYLLLGETDSSTCGDAWATWGKALEVGCKR